MNALTMNELNKRLSFIAKLTDDTVVHQQLLSRVNDRGFWVYVDSITK